MTKKLDGFLNEEFAKLCCKEMGIKYKSCWAEYADLGNCNSYIDINWTDKKGDEHDEQIEVMDALNLISKHILKNSK